MRDEVKDVLCRIIQLEQEGSDSIEAGKELGRLYSRMKLNNFHWSTREKRWVYDYIDSGKEDSVSIPEPLQGEGDN